MTRLDRRQFLTATALAAGGALMTSRLAFASANTSSRFVFIILRGALDGLTAVPPYGDSDYARLRREIAVPAPGSANGVIKLDNLFGLHPNLRFLGDSYAARELVVFHAVASPYRERSHFDGQDVLENGFVRPHASQSGWLNRALAAVPVSSRKELGVALGQNVPLVMRGPAAVASWSPSKLAALDEDTLERITDLYSRDPLLSKRLADALSADAIANGDRCSEPTNAVADRNRRFWQRSRRRLLTTARQARARQGRRGRALCRGYSCRSKFSAPGRRPADRGLRRDGLGYSRERGRRAGPARRATGRARCGPANTERATRPHLEKHGRADCHRVRPYRRDQRHARHGSRHRRGGIPARWCGSGWPRCRRLARPLLIGPL